MGNYEHIFIKSDDEIECLARQISQALNVQLSKNEAGEIFLGRPASDGEPGFVGGELAPNIYGSFYPDEESVIDKYQFVWTINYPRRTEETQRREAAKIIESLADVGKWPVVLLWGMDILAAAALSGQPVTWFPPRTSPDQDQREVWLDFA